MKETAILEQKTEKEASSSKKKRYQGMTWFIIFSMVETKPDIAFATCVGICFAKNSGHQYTKATITILHYFKGLRDQRITYGGQNKLKVEKYSDSDWVGGKKSRKFTSGFIFIFNRGPVGWCLKKQPTLALLSTKAKYMALTFAAEEVT